MNKTPSVPVLYEQDSSGDWHWFCMEDECCWSGMGLLTKMGAQHEADRHYLDFHPELTENQPSE